MKTHTHSSAPALNANGGPARSPTYDRKLHYTADKAKHYDANRTGALSTPLARHRWQEELRVVEAFAESISTTSSVLDLPCGTGRFFPIFASRGHDVIGGDVSGDMLRAIPESHRNLPRVISVRCEVERIPMVDQAVDFVLAMRFWSFLPDEVRRLALAEWRRVARRGVCLQVRFQRDAIASKSNRLNDRRRSAEDLPVESIPAQQRANWPTQRQFTDMIEASGFELTEMIDLDWGPTDDPVRLCVLR